MSARRTSRQTRGEPFNAEPALTYGFLIEQLSSNKD